MYRSLPVCNRIALSKQQLTMRNIALPSSFKLPHARFFQNATDYTGIHGWTGLKNYSSSTALTNQHFGTWGYHVRRHILSGHLDVRINEDQSETAIMPGFSYGDLDSEGEVKMWRMMQQFRCGIENTSYRVKQHPGRHGLALTDLSKKNRAVMLNATLHVLPEFYTMKEDFLYKPLLYKQYLNKLGTTSVNLVAELYDQTGFLLARTIQVLLFVDKKTLTPVKLPESFLSKVGKIQPKFDVDRLGDAEMPSDAFRTTANVSLSDLDYNYHCTNSSYVRMAINGAMEACLADKFQSLRKENIAGYKVKSMKMLHSGETKPGDRLDAFVWEDEHEARRIHYQMDKDGQTVYYATIEFLHTSDL